MADIISMSDDVPPLESSSHRQSSRLRNVVNYSEIHNIIKNNKNNEDQDDENYEHKISNKRVRASTNNNKSKIDNNNSNKRLSKPLANISNHNRINGNSNNSNNTNNRTTSNSSSVNSNHNDEENNNDYIDYNEDDDAEDDDSTQQRKSIKTSRSTNANYINSTNNRKNTNNDDNNNNSGDFDIENEDLSDRSDDTLLRRWQRTIETIEAENMNSDGVNNKHKSRAGKDKDGFASAGIIKKINLKQFMSHSNFTFTFNPHINFINGVNGSGKSAVLTALQVVFGCKASETNRGKGIHDLIQWGKDRASVTITLKNEGPDAYKHELYGDTIELTRTITKNSSTYSIKYANDYRNHTIKRKDVLLLCDYFNIQVTNPCVLLDQTASKKFLSSKDDHNKYDFFLQATQLDPLWNKLVDIDERIKEMNEIMVERKADLDKKNQVITELEAKLAAANKLTDLEAHLLQEEYLACWKAITVLEYKRDFQENNIQIHQKEIKEMNDKLIEKKEVYGKFDIKQNELNVQLTASEQDLANKRTEIRQIDMKLRSNANEQKAFLQNERARKGQLRETKNHLLQAEEEYNRVLELSQRDTAAEENERRLKIQQIQNQVDSKVIIKQNLEKERIQLKDEGNDKAEQFVNWRRQYNEAQGAITRTKLELEEIKGKTNNEQRKFVSKAPEISSKINELVRSGEFSVTPIGPVGNYIEIKDNKWAVAIESCIGNTNLTAYLVNSFADYRLLQSIFKTIYGDNPSPMICTMAHKNYRVYKQHTDRIDIPQTNQLVLDVVEAKNDWIFNFLVDQCKIETSVLQTDHNIAYDFVARYHGVVTSCFLTNGSKIEAKGQLGNGSPSIVSNPSKVKGLLSMNMQQEIERRTEIYKKALEDEKVHAKFEERIRKEQKEISNRIHKVESELRVVNELIDDLTVELEQIREQAVQSNHDLEVKDALDNKQRLINEVAELEVQMNQSLEPLNKLKEEEKQIKIVLTQAQDEEKNIEEQNDKISIDISKNSKAREQDKKEQAILLQRIGQTEHKIAELQRLKETYVNQLTESLEASTVFNKDRPSAPIERKLEDIEANINKLRAKIEAEKKRLQRQQGFNPVSTREEWTRLTAEYDETIEKYQKTSKLKIQLQEAVQSRKDRWEHFRIQILKESSRAFGQYLNLNQCTGSISADKEDKTLSLIVNTDISGSQENETSDSKALSGGERSFTTTAFVMAIGAAIECPFRAMDEFDVFMDTINRKLAIDLLLKAARVTRNRQFIFLTPLDISSLNVAEDLKVFKLNPPDRMQERLNFEPQQQQEEQ